MFFLDSSSSDDDEVSCMRIKRRALRDGSNPLCLAEKDFRKQFRLSKAAFKFVLDGSTMPCGSRGTGIPPILRLAATLNFLGSGSYQVGVGSNFLLGMAQSTVSKVVADVISTLETDLCENWIKLDPQNFHRMKRSSHVLILKPKNNEHMYFNRKGTHSINVMIICDHSYRILAINACYGGASHDSFVWGLSEEKLFFENRFNSGDKSSWLLGDSGYALAPWLLSPYRMPNSENGETLFNTVHSKARSLVERTIGLLKGRCLQDERRMRYSPEKASSVISVSAALHNICLHFNVGFNSSELYLPGANVNLSSACEETSDRNLKRIAERTRNEIKNSLLNINI